MGEIVGLFIFGMVLAVIVPIIGVFLGAFSGWMVGLVFEQTIIGTLSQLGFNLDGISMWELGATLGFVGGYLKTTVATKK